jgi:hypothetical protein
MLIDAEMLTLMPLRRLPLICAAISPRFHIFAAAAAIDAGLAAIASPPPLIERRPRFTPARHADAARLYAELPCFATLLFTPLLPPDDAFEPPLSALCQRRHFTLRLRRWLPAAEAAFAMPLSASRHSPCRHLATPIRHAASCHFRILRLLRFSSR